MEMTVWYGGDVVGGEVCVPEKCVLPGSEEQLASPGGKETMVD